MVEMCTLFLKQCALASFKKPVAAPLTLTPGKHKRATKQNSNRVFKLFQQFINQQYPSSVSAQGQ